MFNENRDQVVVVIRNCTVAGALPANRQLKPNGGVRGERNHLEIGDQKSAVTQSWRVASAEPARLELKPSALMPARALIAIGDQFERVTQLPPVPAAARAIMSPQPKMSLRGRRSFPQIDDQGDRVTQASGVIGERSTSRRMKPSMMLSSARAFPEIGRHGHRVTQMDSASEGDRHALRQWFIATQMVHARPA